MREFFPILLHWTDKDMEPALPKVPWWLIEAARDQCLINHGQTPERLADRGGLSPRELYAVLRGERFPFHIPREDWATNAEVCLYLRGQCSRKKPAAGAPKEVE